MGIRTIITLSTEDKKWLEHYSHQSRQSMAETIRKAIRYFMKSTTKDNKTQILKQTAGLWVEKSEDALEYIESLREEWR